MKCPKCGKKMKKTTCAKCGYDSAKVEVAAAPAAAPAMPNPTMRVNYYTYDPANPSVVYPMAITGQGQANPAMVTVAPTQTTAQSAATTQTEDFSTKVGKRAEKIAKKLAKKAENKMTGRQKEIVETAIDAVDKIEEKVPSNILSRLFAIVVIGLCVFSAVGMPFHVVQDFFVGAGASTGVDMAKGSLLAILSSMMNSGAKLFGLLPAVSIDGTSGTLYTLSIYSFALCIILGLVHAFFAIFSREKAPKRVRRALFFLGLGALQYSAAMPIMLDVWSAEIGKLQGLLSIAGFTIDTFALAVGAGCLILSFLLLIFRRRPKHN